MTEDTLLTLVVIFGVAALVPLVTDLMRQRVPFVVLEIAGGVLVGPAVLGWAHDDDAISLLSSFGLGTLMFFAGYEIDFARIRGRPLTRAAEAWGLSLAGGLGVAAVLWLAGHDLEALVIGLALTTTALGTLLPILRDRGEAATPFGTLVLAAGAVGEFGPIVAVSLLLTSTHPLLTALLLVGFTLAAVGGAALAMRPTPRRLARVVTATLATSGQLAVRLTMFLLLALVLLADRLGLDLLLGAFAAGIVAHAFFATGDPREERIVYAKLEALGFGFLIPLYFVVSGLRFDLDALLASAPAMLALPGFLAAYLVIRGGPTLLMHRDLPRAEALALALYSATALPLVVVITDIGVQDGKLASDTAAAMVGAAMLSVLLLPQLAAAVHRRASEWRDGRPEGVDR